MSCLGMDADRQAGLSEQARDALTRELFARWEAAEPGRHHCFAGSNADLIAAVERLRHHQDRDEHDRDVQDRDVQGRDVQGRDVQDRDDRERG